MARHVRGEESHPAREPYPREPVVELRPPELRRDDPGSAADLRRERGRELRGRRRTDPPGQGEAEDDDRRHARGERHLAPPSLGQDEGDEREEDEGRPVGQERRAAEEEKRKKQEDSEQQRRRRRHPRAAAAGDRQDQEGDGERPRVLRRPGLDREAQPEIRG